MPAKKGIIQSEAGSKGMVQDLQMVSWRSMALTMHAIASAAVGIKKSHLSTLFVDDMLIVQGLSFRMAFLQAQAK
jgi:hypothetical protein